MDSNTEKFLAQVAVGSDRMEISGEMARDLAATIETLRAEIRPLRRLHDALVNAGNDPEKAKTEMAVAGLEADMARVNTDSTGAFGKEGQHGQ